MELLQLQYFKKVANLESITKAAKELHIAQPSLSKTIARLEEQVGTKLFDRVGKRIQLNDAGKLFLGRVENALKELDNGIKEVRDLVEQQEQRIRIGTATAKLLPGLMHDYLIENPAVKIRFLQVTNHNELLQKLQQNEVDICISSLPLKDKGICCKPLTVEKIYLLVPKEHKFAEEKMVRFRDINDEPLIHYTAECGFREIIEEFCETTGVFPYISCECTTPEVTCKLIEAGIGIAFLPEYLFNVEYTKNLAWIPVTEPDLKRTIWISWNEERYLSKKVAHFRDFVFEYFGSS